MKKEKAKLDGMKFGIEIEISQAGQEEVKSAIRDFHGWRVVSDCSVNDGCEVVSPILTYNQDTLETLKRLFATIKRELPAASADDSTGGHVHVEYKNNSDKVKNLVREFYSKQSLLFDACKVGQDRQEDFCRSFPANLVQRVKGTRKQEVLDTAQAVEYLNKIGLRQYSDRYMALNLTSLAKHGTVEFRLFNGSLNFETWKANVQLSLAICNKAKQARRASDKVKKYNYLTARYDMRTWLLRLGFIGLEFKTARQIFRESLPVYHTDGHKADTAWRYGRKSRDMAGNIPELNG